MERKRFSVLFFIKRSKLLKNGEAPVRVRVTYDRLYVELQLKRSVKVPLWSQDKEKSIGKDRNSVELNHYIDALRVGKSSVRCPLKPSDSIPLCQNNPTPLIPT